LLLQLPSLGYDDSAESPTWSVAESHEIIAVADVIRHRPKAADGTGMRELQEKEAKGEYSAPFQCLPCFKVARNILLQVSRNVEHFVHLDRLQSFTLCARKFTVFATVSELQ
jgi:hypothetical protein